MKWQLNAYMLFIKKDLAIITPNNLVKIGCEWIVLDVHIQQQASFF
jgi:hypothetical protein